MLIFLRKIRKKLLKDNKIASYLIYAVGEIFLVVVGILIAVSLNNWNNERKDQEKIDRTVDFMIEELKKDSVAMVDELDYHHKAIQKVDSLFKRMQHPDATFDTILHIMKYEYDARWTTHFLYNSTAYESMKSLGLFESLPDLLSADIDRLYKNLESTSSVMDMYSNQYREPLEEFVKRYTIGKDSTTLVFKTAWANVNPEHFVPRAWWLVFTKNLLFSRYVLSLEENQSYTNELIVKLRQYRSVNN